MLSNFSYIRTRTLNDAVKHASSERAVVHAGGTDLLGCLRDNVFEADKVVSIGKIDQLNGIRKLSDGSIRIGALTTITEIAESPLLKQNLTGLAQGASEVASPQLRNQGTIGGNICQKPRCWYYRGEFYCLRKGGDHCFAVGSENKFHCIFGGSSCFIVHPSDTAPNLLAAKAQVKITGPNGSRTMPIDNFWVPPVQDPQRETVLEPGEIVTDILLRKPPENMKSSYRKIRARRSWDFALVSVALALTFEGDKVADGSRVVFGGVAPIPWRSREVEKVIIGKTLNPEIIEKASEAAIRGAQPMTQNEYKVPLLKAAVFEELANISGA